MSSVSERSVLVYDVGGSHIAAAVCHAESYRLGPIVSVPHPALQSSHAFVRALNHLATETSAGLAPVSGAELAFPGPFDFSDGISRMKHKLPYLYGVDLRQALAGQLQLSPASIRFVKDSDAFLLGEIGAGAARGVERAVGITLGTGFGAAFAVDGRIVTDLPGVPPGGEMWDLPYQGGIIEDAVSTRAIRGAYQRLTGQDREVAALAGLVATDAAAAAAFEEFGVHLGRALRDALAVFDPEVIVVGGGISRSAQLFLPTAQRQLAGLRAQFRVATLLDAAPLAGAGYAWFNAPAVAVKASDLAAR